MKKRLSALIASLIVVYLCSQQALANLTERCLSSVPAFTKPIVKATSASIPVHIEANKVTANYPEHMLFSGNVSIENSNSTLAADEVQLTQRLKQNKTPLLDITATGNVNYSSNEIKLQGYKAWSNLNTKDIDIYHGNYQMAGRQGRGDADTIKQRGDNRYTILKNGSFTSCLPGDNSWSIVGSEVIHDRKEQITKIWNACFKIGKIPVFYSPYLQIPIGDKRRSGFLIPYANYDNNNGFKFSVPYYLNLAPNYDATITPNYINKHKTQLQTELRYLTPPGEGLVEFDWLPNYKLYNNEHTNATNGNRWLIYWHHNGTLDQVWHFNVDYTKVSDSNYFNDLNSKYSNTDNSRVARNFILGYADKNWDSNLSHKQFQVININSNYSYCTSSQLNLTYHKNDIGPFDLEIFNQAAKFTNVNNYYPEATRLHIEPIINLTLNNHWNNLNAEAKLIATHYQQKYIDFYNKNDVNHHLKRLVNRFLPQFKADDKMIFERGIDNATTYIQTLEPRLQYLYIPYRNQDNIGLYDATILPTDYSSLFRDRTYSGLDRISSANQLAGGVTIRIYDNHREERFNVSVGQIYCLSQHYTERGTGTCCNHDNSSIASAGGDSYWRISDQWGIRGSLQYNSFLNSVVLGDAILEYRCDENRILQLNYRYVSSHFVKQMLADISHPAYKQGISQVGITGSWSLVNHWSLLGAYYYDTKANQSTDQLVGLQYNTCCWAINVGYKRNIICWNNANNSSQHDNKVSLNIELIGLSSNYSLGLEKLLGSTITPIMG